MADEGGFDYAKTGMKVGLEIHQQIDAGKLFYALLS
jgi:Glu-tRNA(Gln) amidotransferase subunit E-like FAD-binding protein